MPSLMLGVDHGTTATKAVLVDPGEASSLSLLCPLRSTPTIRAGPRRTRPTGGRTSVPSSRCSWIRRTPRQVTLRSWRHREWCQRCCSSTRADSHSCPLPCRTTPGQQPRSTCWPSGSQASTLLLERALPCLAAVRCARRSFGHRNTHLSSGSRHRWVVGSYDWLAMALGAAPHVDRNWALESGLYELSGLTDADTLTGEFVEEVVEAAGISPERLAPVRASGQVIGEVSSRCESGDRTGGRAPRSPWGEPTTSCRPLPQGCTNRATGSSSWAEQVTSSS